MKVSPSGTFVGHQPLEEGGKPIGDVLAESIANLGDVARPSLMVIGARCGREDSRCGTSLPEDIADHQLAPAPDLSFCRDRTRSVHTDRSRYVARS